jgi:hypothetical protein
MAMALPGMTIDRNATVSKMNDSPSTTAKTIGVY